jgi:hypothetical protein
MTATPTVIELTKAFSYIGPCLSVDHEIVADTEEFLGSELYLDKRPEDIGYPCVGLQFLRADFEDSKSGVPTPEDLKKFELWKRSKVQMIISPLGAWAAPRSIQVKGHTHGVIADYTDPAYLVVNQRTQMMPTQNLYMDFWAYKMFTGPLQEDRLAGFYLITDLVPGEKIRIQLVLRSVTRQVVQYE